MFNSFHFSEAQNYAAEVVWRLPRSYEFINAVLSNSCRLNMKKTASSGNYWQFL
jgi:hypothetical protein